MTKPTTTITTQEMAEALGVNKRTLTRWHQRGLIKPPRLGSPRKGGAGVVGYYSPATLERCKKIIALRQYGYSLKQIDNHRHLYGAGLRDEEFPKMVDEEEILKELRNTDLKPLKEVLPEGYAEVTPDTLAIDGLEAILKGLEKALSKDGKKINHAFNRLDEELKKTNDTYDKALTSLVHHLDSVRSLVWVAMGIGSIGVGIAGACLAWILAGGTP